MPHLHIEIARGALERRLHGVQIQVDPSGGPDILAPPFPIRQTLPTPLGIVRVQLIVRSVVLQSVLGSAQSRLALGFDEGSVEFLSTGQAEGLLGGALSVPFTLRFNAVAVANGQQARLVADFAGSAVVFSFDTSSKARLVAKVGQGTADLAEAAISAALSLQFGSLAPMETGVNLRLTPGIPSEDLMVVEGLPSVAWVDPETLAGALQYASEPTPAPFQPVPFLPAGQPAAFGLRLSNDGFQRTIRNQAIRRLARASLSARLIDRFVHDAYVQRGGSGPVTDQDKADGQARLEAYLLTPQGLLDIANETPAPVGNGKLRKRITAPDPFSDFDVEVPELDLWLGNDRIEGRAKATGTVNGFGFTAHLRFRARPVLIQQPISIEMHNIEIDDPDIEIDLPPWLEWTVGLLVTLLTGSALTGVIVGFLLSSIVASLVEAFIPSDLGSKVPPPQGQEVGLPTGVTLTQLAVIPEFLAMLGRWSFTLQDPRPFMPSVRIADRIERTKVGPAREGVAYFTCLGDLGFVADSTAERGGTRFKYMHQNWRSRVTAEVQATVVPLPLTRFPWTIAVGHRSMAQYHFPKLTTARQPLAPGNVTFMTDVWHPEPPLGGHVASASYTVGVQSTGENGFTIDVPAASGCIVIELATKVVDASGYTWDLLTIIDVPNETVVLEDQEAFDKFTGQCERRRREWPSIEEPSLLDKVWNPPNVLATRVQQAIRTGQPAVATTIAGVVEKRGIAGLNVILAPSLVQRR
jgi:hypothetical protein